MNLDTRTPDQRHAINGVLHELKRERAAQHQKWGEQTLPWVDPLCESASGNYRTNFYELPHADAAKRRTDRAAQLDRLTYADVLIEEVAEAVAAPTIAEARAELIQVAAVAAAAVESIDRGDDDG